MSDAGQRNSSFSSKRRLGALMALAVAGLTFFARIPAIQNRSMGSNESTTLLAISGNALPNYPEHIAPAPLVRDGLFEGVTSYANIAQELLHSDGHPPTFYWILATWNQVFGTGLAPTRFLSNTLASGFVLGLGLIFAFEVGMGTFEILLFELLIAFSSDLSFFATEARSYMFCLLLIVVIIASALRTIQATTKTKAQYKWMLLTGILTGLAVFTNYLMAFTALATGIWLLLETRSVGLRRTFSNASLFIVPNIVLALMSRHFYDAQKAVHESNRNGYKGFASDFLIYSKDFVRTFVNLIDVPISLVVTAMLGLAIFTIVTHKKTSTQKSLLRGSILLTGASVAAVFLVNIVFNKFLYPFRYFVFATPGIFAVLGIALSVEAKPLLRHTLSVLVLLTLGLELQTFNWQGEAINVADFSKSPYREIVQSVLSQTSRGNNTLILIEHTAERDWPTGLINEFSQNSEIPVLVLPKTTDAQEFINSSPDLAPFKTIWYMALDEVSPGPRQQFESTAHELKNFAVRSSFDWGYRMDRSR